MLTQKNAMINSVLKLSTATVPTLAAMALFGSQAQAYPVNPNKVAVTNVDLTGLRHEVILAYDSNDKSVVYYSPKTGRLADMNGMPLIGFAMFPDGRAILNAQLEFGLYGDEREKLLTAIRRAGYTPVPMPYLKTTVKPLTPGFNPETGKRECSFVPDESDPDKAPTQICESTIYESISYVRSGPTLGENIAITTILNPSGALIYKNLLRSGNAIQVALEAEYYTAGDSFTATVEVNYEKLLESFSVFASAKGWFFSEAEWEGYWQKQGLCYGQSSDNCSVRVHLVDGRGRRIENIALDPDNKDMELIHQAVERLKRELEQRMITPLAPILGKAEKNNKGMLWGYTVNAKYQNIKEQMHAKFEFKSPRAINVSKTTITAGLGCAIVNSDGSVERSTQADCKGYWDGSLRYDQLTQRK